MEATLLLNASFEPIKVISWQRAVTLLFLGKVEVVENYDREIHSVSLALKMPAVVRLLRYVKLARRKPPLTRINLLARDGFSCQYCGRHLSNSDATMDHVLPRSQGGTTHWFNVVAACHPCNRRKGGRTPIQARMALRQDPFEPDWLPVITMRFYHNLPSSWYTFLDPSEDLD
ncbi:MAG: HNH endonuclease [Deltaproteobacteria bacterium]|nr:HNH endonuclease [Deltaproteobacteria bacterium]